MLQFGLRLGEAPRVVVTTTPRPMPLLQRLVEDDDAAGAHADADNRCFLAPQFLRDIEARYGGTRLGRQELEAEIIDDDPDALFRRELIEAGRVRAAPDLVRIVVAIDPPATKGARANACGIVCAGLGRRQTCLCARRRHRAGRQPVGVGQAGHRALSFAPGRPADRRSQPGRRHGRGGDPRGRSTVSFKAVHASRGKRLRAEPVAALYEQGRVCMSGCFPSSKTSW
jgi:phage terminase large subunit-like protein